MRERWSMEEGGGGGPLSEEAKAEGSCKGEAAGLVRALDRGGGATGVDDNTTLLGTEPETVNDCPDCAGRDGGFC